MPVVPLDEEADLAPECSPIQWHENEAQHLALHGPHEPLDHRNASVLLDGPEALAAAFAASGSKTAVICASPEQAPEVIPLLAREIKALRGHRVLVVGRPGRLETAWRDAGVDGFVQRNVDAIALLTDLHESEGVGRD